MLGTLSTHYMQVFVCLSAPPTLPTLPYPLHTFSSVFVLILWFETPPLRDRQTRRCVDEGVEH